MRRSSILLLQGLDRGVVVRPRSLRQSVGADCPRHQRSAPPRQRHPVCAGNGFVPLGVSSITIRSCSRSIPFDAGARVRRCLLHASEARRRNHSGRRAVSVSGAASFPWHTFRALYSAITTGSERTVLARAADERGGVPRPRPEHCLRSGRLASAPAIARLFHRRTDGCVRSGQAFRTDLRPAHSPPPVVGGSLAYDSTERRNGFVRGGHVAERGPSGKVAGCTGTWIFRDNDWQRLPGSIQPPPRMNHAHGGRSSPARDGAVRRRWPEPLSRRHLALRDLKTKTWRTSKAREGPEPRAGHFTVYDPATGWAIVGGGYNRRDLTDMWAYDTAAENG